MRLALMQPYFFPYIGYYQLIAVTDRWIVFDTAQFSRQSWMYRNRILHPKQGWQYVSLDLHQASPHKRVMDIMLVDRKASEHKLLGQLEHYRKQGPHYRQVRELVRETFAGPDDDSLVSLNISSLSTVCEYLDIPFRHARFSELGLEFPPIAYPGQWPLELATMLHAQCYINAPGGKSLFRAADFAARGIALRFLPLPDFVYSCGGYGFQPYLSMLDVLMWNSPEQVREFLLTPPRLDTLPEGE